MLEKQKNQDNLEEKSEVGVKGFSELAAEVSLAYGAIISATSLPFTNDGGTNIAIVDNFTEGIHVEKIIGNVLENELSIKE